MLGQGNWVRRELRAIPSDRHADVVATGRAAGLHQRDGVGPLPSLGAEPGAVGLRLVVDGRARRDDQAALRHRRDPARLPLPPGDPRPGRRDAGGDVPGPLLPRTRRGRGAERAHRRRLLAGGAGPARAAGRVDRDHPAALHRQGRQVPLAALQRRERQALHPAAARRRRSMWRPRDRSRPSAPAGPATA